jgi:hypothetical protein
VDLLGIMAAVEHAREIARLARGTTLPEWDSDPQSFLRHFGATHEEYAEIVSHLSPEQVELLHNTLAVNPEAAVLWVLAMEEVE